MIRSLPARVALLLSITVVVVGSYWTFVAPLPQPTAYHNFADQQTMLGVPHAQNVLSNWPFIAVGAAGIWFMGSSRSHRPGVFIEEIERWPYWVYFVGLILTGLGSMYYHANPNNETLTWDRMFLAITFMALFAGILAERLHVSFARFLLWPLVVLGAASVAYWQYTEQIGAGDLRFYFTVQFFPLLVLPLLLLLYPSRYTGTADLVAMLASYVLAKGLEILDAEVYAGTGFVSGHTLKHLVAGLAAGFVLVMLWRRQPTSAVAPAEPSAVPVPHY
jgi:hypothetical protein